MKQCAALVLATILLASPAWATSTTNDTPRREPAGKVVIKGKGGTVTDVKQEPPPQEHKKPDRKKK